LNRATNHMLRFMLDRTITQIGEELEQAAVRLKETREPDLRRELLVHMRFLLMEADTLLVDPPTNHS
jgi:hypothetical protein